MTPKELKARRITEGISGALVSLKSGIGRSRLSDIERGYATATDKETQLLQNALESLIRARRKASQVAIEEGWPIERF